MAYQAQIVRLNFTEIRPNESAPDLALFFPDLKLLIIPQDESSRISLIQGEDASKGHSTVGTCDVPESIVTSAQKFILAQNRMQETRPDIDALLACVQSSEV